MRNIEKLRLFSKKRLFTLVPALFFILMCGAVPASVHTVSAAPQSGGGGGNDTTATVKYCKAHISGKAQSACTTKNANSLRDAVSDNCNGANKNACIENAAEGVIDQVARKNPSSESDFNNILDNVLNASKHGGGGGGAGGGGGGGAGASVCDDGGCDLIANYVNPSIRLLSALVGLVAAISLIMGGIQYSASTGDPQKTSAAKSRISKTILGLIIYAFLYAFLNFLVPGGIFN